MFTRDHTEMLTSTTADIDYIEDESQNKATTTCTIFSIFMCIAGLLFDLTENPNVPYLVFALWQMTGGVLIGFIVPLIKRSMSTQDTMQVNSQDCKVKVLNGKEKRSSAKEEQEVQPLHQPHSGVLSKIKKPMAAHDIIDMQEVEPLNIETANEPIVGEQLTRDVMSNMTDITDVDNV